METFEFPLYLFFLMFLTFDALFYKVLVIRYKYAERKVHKCAVCFSNLKNICWWNMCFAELHIKIKRLNVSTSFSVPNHRLHLRSNFPDHDL